MKKTIRKNYLLPVEVVREIERKVKSGRYASESEFIRRSIQLLLEQEARRAERITQELDDLAGRTSRFLPARKTAGELVHEIHEEEQHW